MGLFRLRGRARRAQAILAVALGTAWAGTDDGSRDSLLAAYREGMSLDSLYYLLAREAMLAMSFDTAMAFNLSIPTPGAGPFRDSLLSQRYRLYVLSGLHEDARALQDSLPGLAGQTRLRRRPEWDLKLLSGYSGERHGLARSYPSGLEVPGIDTAGWQVKHQGRLGLPLPSPIPLPLSLSLGYEVSKTYYKDSLDYRGELLLQASLPVEGLSAGIGMELGRINGVGTLVAAKGDATWFSFARSGTRVTTAGYEVEWESSGEKRYDAAWASLFREWELGNLGSLHGMLAATWLGMAPLKVPGMGNVIFVDDVAKSQPVHYRDGSYRDTVPRTPPMTTYHRYQEARDSLDFQSPQDALTLRAGLGFSRRIGLGILAGIGGTYAFAFHPDPYRWLEVQGNDTVPAGQQFSGYARNRADGRYYRAYMTPVSGGFTETYLPTPLKEESRQRLDHRFGGDLTFSRRFGRWSLVLAGTAERTVSTVSEKASIWIPEWDYGVSLRWTLSGGGR